MQLVAVVAGAVWYATGYLYSLYTAAEHRPRPNALTFGLASYTPRRGGQGIDIDTSYLWGYSVVGGWAGAGAWVLGVPVRSGTGTAHSIPHTAQAREERLVYALGGCSA